MLQTGYLRLVGGGASAQASIQGAGRQKGDQQLEQQDEAPAPEGMGLTYQAMAITAANAEPPIPFA